mmetsp:Transcript_6713/g.11540  ORF Transcript_6713/g.11540 Transcript_6713/m.11540 type:complete len:239 (+) Transcript_6713:203-919(+)
MPTEFSCVVAIWMPSLFTNFSRMLRRCSSASCARRAAKACAASPSASPSAFLPLAIFSATAIFASACFCFWYAWASASRRPHSAAVFDLISLSMDKICDFIFEISNSAFASTCFTSTSRCASNSAMSLVVCATTSEVSLIAWVLTTCAFCSAAIRALSHSSFSFCLPSSLFSLKRSDSCCICFIVVLDSKSVLSSKSCAMSLGICTFLTVKSRTATPNFSNFLFISSTIPCVFCPCKS